MEAFSTIRSPVFSELVVILSGMGIASLPHGATLFQTLRKMHDIRPFELVFMFEGPCSVQRGGQWQSVEARWELKEALDYVVSRGFLDFLGSPPTIRVDARPRDFEWDFPNFD